MKIEQSEGFLVLTTFEPRRRWYGVERSKFTLQVAIPFQDTGAELTYDLAHGWMRPQDYWQIRIPANIKIFK